MLLPNLNQEEEQLKKRQSQKIDFLVCHLQKFLKYVGFASILQLKRRLVIQIKYTQYHEEIFGRRNRVCREHS